VFIHVLPEFLAARLEDVPRAAGAGLHLFEDPSLLVALEDRRDLRDDVPPDALLKDLMAPVLECEREALLPPRVQGRFWPGLFQEVRDIVPHDGFPLPDQGRDVVLAGGLEDFLSVVVRRIPRVKLDALEGEHAIRGDAIVADVHRIEERTGGHGTRSPRRALRFVAAWEGPAQLPLTKRH